MSTSLKSLRGGSYGFGVKPLRGTLMTNRTVPFPSVAAMMNPYVPNGAFVIPSSADSITVYGADGNIAGTALTTTLIDGTNQRINGHFQFYSQTDNLFYTLVTNEANEARLIKANYSGVIQSVGAKFTPTTIGNFKNICFVYEQGASLKVRAVDSTVGSWIVYEQTISKATGQPTAQNTVIGINKATSNPTYISQDGNITFGSCYSVDSDLIKLLGITVNGAAVPEITINAENATAVRLGVINRHFYPKLSGNYVVLMPVALGDPPVVMPLIARSEFDRWLKDIVSKFSFA